MSQQKAFFFVNSGFILYKIKTHKLHHHNSNNEEYGILSFNAKILFLSFLRRCIASHICVYDCYLPALSRPSTVQLELSSIPHPLILRR